MRKKLFFIRLLNLAVILFLITVSLLASGMGQDENRAESTLGNESVSNSRTTESTVIIGTGNKQRDDIPINTRKNYSFSQTLYFQTELNFENKEIKQIGYQYAGSNTNLELEIEVWLGHTDLEELTESVQLPDFTKVFDGIWVCSSNDDFTANDIIPFVYNNEDNLIIMVIEKGAGNEGRQKFYSTKVDDVCIDDNGNTPFDPYNLPPGDDNSYRANIKLWIDDAIPPGPPVPVITPLSLDFGEVTIGGGKVLTVQLENIGLEPLEITGFTTTNDHFTVENLSFPLILNSSESETIEIHYNPVSVEQETGVITFLMDPGIAGDKDVQVSGTGTLFDMVIIGADTYEHGEIPVYARKNYSFSQTLYFQTELNIENKVIEQIGYQYAGSNTNLELEIEVWLAHTDLEELTESVPLSGFIKLYDGPWVCSSNDNFSVIDINPFVYNNEDNLIIMVIEKEPDQASSSDKFYSTSVASGQDLCVGEYDNYIPFDPNNLPEGNIIDYRANTKLWFGDIPIGPPISEITPLSLAFGEVTIGESKVLTVQLVNTGVDPLEITGITTTNDHFTVENLSLPLILSMSESKTIEIHYNPESTEQETGVITLQMDPGIAGDRDVQVSGKGSVFDLVFIGSGTSLCLNTPIYPSKSYSFTQTLYLQTELNIENKVIEQIGYQYAGVATDLEFNIEVWISHTDLEELTTSVPLTHFTKVYDGVWICNAGEEFSVVDIDAFYYNNTDNLIITVIEKEPGYTASTDKFYGTPYSGSMCVGAWNNDAPYDSNNLPSGSNINKRANVKLWLSGDLPTEPKAQTSPESLYFGEIEVLEPGIMTVQVMNAGGGILEILGVDITNSAFSVVNTAFPVNLPIGQKETFDIQFLPNEPGLKEGVLTFVMDESIPGTKTVALSGRALRVGVLQEGFEGELFPPLGWKVIDNNNEGTGWLRNTGFVPTGQTGPRTGITCASLDVYAGNIGQISYDDWLITPKMTWQDNDIFMFYIKRVANQAGQTWRVCLSTTGSDVSDFFPIDEITDPPMTYGEKSYDLGQYGLFDGDNYYIGIQFYSLWCWPGVIDDVLGSVPVRYDNDLMVLGFTGSDIMYENTTGNYQTTIGNYGFNGVTDGEYSVQICAYVNGVETVLASVSGEALASGETTTLTIPMTIPDAGLYDIYSKIVWGEDMDLTNNFSDIINVEVFPISVVIKNIGDFPISLDTDYTNNFPIDFYDSWRYSSLSECLYYKNELNTGGLIERLTYYKQFSTDMNQRKIKVWMGETDQTSLDDNYIPPSQLQLVFDGMVDFTEGLGKANIVLTDPYVYTGNGNLVVNVYYYDGSSYSNAAEFAYAGSSWKRTAYENGWQSIDPENPASIKTVTSYPMTSLLFETGNGTGALSGYVYYQADNQPVEGAKIEIYNPDFPQATAVLYTNAQGQYSAPYAMAGENLMVIISKFGYIDAVYENVNLASGASVNMGSTYLVDRIKIVLSGSVFTSDTQEPARFATVKIIGMENYETTTDVTGTFEFEEVWGSTTYDIEVSLEGYQTYQAEIQVPDTDYTLDPITILENAPAPNLVNVVEQDDDALITWYAVGQPYPMEFRYDDGVAVGRLITPGTPTIFTGSAWPYNAIVTSVSWFNFPSANYPASPEIRVLCLGLTEDGAPDENNVLALIENVPNPEGWNTHQLSESIEASDGFFLGIAGYSNYIVIGYDDGVGEPYEWIPRTQWSNGLGSYNPLENATSPPLHASIMFRASGLVYGESVKSMAPIAANMQVSIPYEGLLSICEAVEPFEAGDPKVLLPYTPAQPDRSFMHYNVFSKELDTPNWTQINTMPVNDTSFIDTQWGSQSFGLYQYGVEAEYTNGVKSVIAQSNVIEKNMRIDVTLIVNTNTGLPGVSAGALVKLSNQNGNVNYIYLTQVGGDGSVVIEDVLKGAYTLEISLAGFEEFLEQDIDLMIQENNFEKTVTLIENIYDPYDLEVITEGHLQGDADFLWNQPPVFDNVDSYEPFLLNNIGDWTVVDQDNQPTVTISGISFPHTGEPSAFMTLNRAMTTPPLSETYWGAHSGNQYFAAFASAEGTTSNWLISPEQNHSLPFTFSFYAKTVNDTYGAETFRIAYSTASNNIADFVYITGNISTLTYWSKFTYTIPAEAKYVAIRHTHTGFAFLVDDILIGVEADNAIPANGFSVYLDDEMVETGIMAAEYDFSGLTTGMHTGGVKAHFYTGESEISEIDFEVPEGTTLNFIVEDDKGVLIDGVDVSLLYNGTEIFSGQSINGFVSCGVVPGTYQYTASKEGLAPVSGEVVVIGDAVDVNVVLNHYYTITFDVANGEGNPISGAMVTFNIESLPTVADGTVSFVTEPGQFSYAITHPNYDRVLATVVVTDDQIENVVMPELTCEAPVELTYSQYYNNIQLNWQEPVSGINGTWLHWDGINTGNSIGTGGLVDFDIAQRFVPADLAAHDGKFLTRILFMPFEELCTYSVRVWVGGNIAEPEIMIVDQVVANPVIGEWNEIFLNTPVLVDATKELWIGVRNNTTTGHPVGCDVGPAVDGKGNMINLAGTGWQTLLEVAPALDFNWSVRGLLEDMDALESPELVSLKDADRGTFEGDLTLVTTDGITGYAEPREVVGYNIYRDDVQLNADLLSAMTFEDNQLPLGTYLYHTTAVYNNGCESGYSNTAVVEVVERLGQIIQLNENWSIISTYQTPDFPQLEDFFSHQIADQTINILIGKFGIFWPGQNINLIGEWNTNEGYKIKMNTGDELNIPGETNENKTVELLQGVNFLPVLSETPVSATEIFNQLEGSLIYAFDIVNGLIYWPEGGIYTLETLEPGSGYLVNVSAPGSIIYPESDGLKHFTKPQPVTIRNAPWTVQNTGIAHLISIYADALEGFTTGDIIGTFNSMDQCVGMVQYDGRNENLGLVVYGDDLTTGFTDGMSDFETMSFRVFKASLQEEIAVYPEWNQQMPNTGLYVDNGLSAITSFKLEALGIGQHIRSSIEIYPNPAGNELFIAGEYTDGTTVEIIDQIGKTVLYQRIQSNNNKLDVSQLQGGLYLVKITLENSRPTNFKLIIK